jgi:hypothetical protein
VRVGDYTFGMRKDDILERLGKPKRIFYGDNKYSLDNPPRNYYMPYDYISFRIHDGLVVEITALSPDYKFANGLRVGDSEKKVKKAFGKDFSIQKSKWKDFLSYKNKGLMFEINTQYRTVMEINVRPIDDSKSRKKGHIPAKSYINEEGRIVDKIDYPFVNVSKIIGTWKSVDFVDEMEEFKAGRKRWRGGDLYLKGLIFHPNGKTFKPWWTWTKGLIFHSGSKTASKYTLKDIEGSTYMFFEWKSGDYTIRHRKPAYYVLEKVSTETLEREPMFGKTVSKTVGKKAHIPASSHINEQGRIVDKTNWPFVNDPRLIGTWKSVDFVREMKQFKVGQKYWKKQWKSKEDELHLKELIFLPNGKTTKRWRTWTKGLVFHSGDKTASKYTLKDIEGSTYMFYEWKSGDYTIRHMKPFYYVLKKVSSETVKHEVDKKAHIPPTSTINEQGRIVDKIDYPFVNDPRLIGTWKSVDFVRETEQFRAGRKQWGGGQLYLKELIFLPNGKTFKPWWTWTKGLVFHSGSKTASKYTIKDIDDSTYMFFEWKSGDYTIRHMKPFYYVLKKVSDSPSEEIE